MPWYICPVYYMERLCRSSKHVERRIFLGRNHQFKVVTETTVHSVKYKQRRVDQVEESQSYDLQSESNHWVGKLPSVRRRIPVHLLCKRSSFPRHKQQGAVRVYLYVPVSKPGSGSLCFPVQISDSGCRF